ARIPFVFVSRSTLHSKWWTKRWKFWARIVAGKNDSDQRVVLSARAHEPPMTSVLEKLGLADDNAGVFDGQWRGGGAKIDKIAPINGQKLASVRTASAEDYEKAISRAHAAVLKWRTTAGPVRGDSV